MRKRFLPLALVLVMCMMFTPVVAAEGDFVIENGVLVSYQGLGGEVTIPDSVISIGEAAFMDCEDLERVTIGKSVESIGEAAFFYCTSLKGITIPDNVKTIGARAFTGCESLKSVTIGNGLTVIEEEVFYNCLSLTSVTIGAGVTSIERKAFFLCESLVSVTIPGNVTEIGADAFPEATMIYCVPGSAAEEFAITNGNKHISTDETGAPLGEDKPSSWAAKDVTVAIAAGIVPQKLQSKYTQAMTRAEFCALAVALYENVTGTEIAGRITFNDTTDINVKKMASLEVVNGVGNGMFSPDTMLTREQAATMISRLAAALGKPIDASEATFNDKASVSEYAQEAVGQMQASGIMSGTGSNAFSPKANYTREQSIITMMRLYNIVK